MKKVLALTMTVAMLATMAIGCSNEQQKTTSGTPAKAGDTQKGGAQASAGTVDFTKTPAKPAPSFDGLSGKKDGKTIKIGYTISANDQYGALMSQALLDKAKSLGVEVKFVEAKENDTNMLNQVQQFVADKVDAIIDQTTNTKICEQVMKIAGKTPVIFLNRQPIGTLSGPAYYVGSDDLQAGLMQAKALTEYFKKNAPDKKELKVIQLLGVLGLANVNARTKGAYDGLTKAGYKVVYAMKDTAKWQRTDATNMMTSFLGTGKDYDCVISNNDEMAIGAILAMKAKNVDFAKKPVVGIDATKDGLLAIKSGQLYCSVYQDAKGQGEGALAVALALIHGKQAPRNVDIPFQLVTKENLSKFMK